MEVSVSKHVALVVGPGFSLEGNLSKGDEVSAIPGLRKKDRVPLRMSRGAPSISDRVQGVGDVASVVLVEIDAVPTTGEEN